ncbi:MAG TPA: CHAD domain-containing protein [Solirubrobacterales bacterium]|nr:CHAD domain-containing protein [Solirubrobacterales bacterium]
MPAEIERKFLVAALPAVATTQAGTKTEQGYVAIGERTEVRLRRAGGRMTLTAKRGAGETRAEHEIALYKEQFEAMWPLTAERRLIKRRHLVSLGNGELVAELDVYGGELRGLATVEVEFASAEEGRMFEPPDWFGAELTGDPAYANQSLAAHGLPGDDGDGDGTKRTMSSKGPSQAYRLKRKEGAADGLRRIARGRVKKATERLRDPSDEELAEAIHGARKDLKKVRAVLRLLREELGQKRFKAEDQRFRDAARLLAESRDAEVKLETLRALRDKGEQSFPHSGAMAWEKALEADRDRVAAARGEGAARVERARAMVEAAGAGISHWPIGSDSWRLLGPGIKRGYREGREALAQVHEDGNAENVHELRKRAKDLWYQLRLLEGSWPGLLEPTAEQAHQLTDLLGDHHDLAVLAEDLGERSGLDHSRPAFEALIESRQGTLLDVALELADRLYAEKPKHFARRLHAYWRAWRG